MYISKFDLLVFSATIIVLAMACFLPKRIRPKSIILLMLLPLYLYYLPKKSEVLEIVRAKSRYPDSEGFNLFYIIFTWPKYWFIALLITLFLLHLYKQRRVDAGREHQRGQG